MPTTRPRHMITETPEVEKWLDQAAQLWPDDRNSRGKLLLHLLEEGHRAVNNQYEAALARRRAAIERTSGGYDDIFPEGYLEELRKDWPE
ncbi:hypothetical protein ACFQ1S_16520 [Kibdelosporangium lantanae]|uniref:CopG family transcriptional regulator n=1 Tax=Kibdelosporangium lantanae TaxID=1497396 RepID=A0ABW3MDH1_9PSEU